jgi:hypothetical protein
MTRLLLTLGAACTIACGQDPARSVKIPRRAAASVAADAVTGTPAPARSRPALHWNAAMCQPAPDASGPGSLAFTGPCAFEQRQGATCVVTDDDLLMKVLRPTSNDGQVLIFVTVENYGSVIGRTVAEVVVGVENAQGLFRWATERAQVTTSDEKSVTLGETHLKAVPPLKEPDVIVSGALTCASIVVAPDAK